MRIVAWELKGSRPEGRAVKRWECWVQLSLSRNWDEKEIKLNAWLFGNGESREHFLGWEKLQCGFRLRKRLWQYSTKEVED